MSSGAVGMLALTVLDPLASLLKASAVYCEPMCCGLKAFDMNAHRLRMWAEYDGGDLMGALAQLDMLIEAARNHVGSVSDETAFFVEWRSGAECTMALEAWRTELVRAQRYLAHGVPTAAERLQNASPAEYGLEIWRLVEEAARLRHAGRLRAARHLLEFLVTVDTSKAPAIATDLSVADKLLVSVRAAQREDAADEGANG